MKIPSTIERGNDHRPEHDRDQERRDPAAVVLAVDEHDRDHDQVGEDERDHAGERDPAGPQHRGERDVPDRAHEGERGDDRADDDVLEQLDRAAGVGDEQAR